MATKAPAHQETSILDPVMIIAVMIMVAVLVTVLWSMFHTKVATVYSWMRIVELFAFKIIGELIPNPLSSWWDFFMYSDARLIEWHHMASSSLVINGLLLVTVIAPISYRVAKRSIRTHPLNHLHFAKPKDYTLHTFTDQMAEYYPHLKLFRKLDLTARSISKGKYRMGDTEKEFAIKHDLLDCIDKEYKINRDRSAEVFRGQMGRLWKSYGNLSTSEYALMAMVIPRIAATDLEMSKEDYDAALVMTEELVSTYWRSSADSYDPETDTLKVDLGLARKSIKTYGKHPNVVRFFKQHAYVSTVLYGMILEARRLGVLAACDVRWLRVIDRRIWLMTDNVGRIVSFCEISGIYCHYLNEVKAKRAIERPMIDAAVKGLFEAVDSFKFDETEVLKIEANLALKKRAKQTLVDLRALARDCQTLVMGLETVKIQGKPVPIGAVLMNERGDVECELYSKLDIEVTDSVIAEIGFDEVRAGRLRDAGLNRGEFCARLIAAVNKHAILVFDPTVLDLIPGFTLSAKMVVNLSEQYEIETKQVQPLPDALVAIGHVTVNHPYPDHPTAPDMAKAAKSLWVWLQKQAILHEKEARAANASRRGR